MLCIHKEKRHPLDCNVNCMYLGKKNQWRNPTYYHVNEVFSDYDITEVHVNAEIRLLPLSDYSQLSDYCDKGVTVLKKEL